MMEFVLAQVLQLHENGEVIFDKKIDIVTPFLVRGGSPTSRRTPLDVPVLPPAG